MPFASVRRQNRGWRIWPLAQASEYNCVTGPKRHPQYSERNMNGMKGTPCGDAQHKLRQPASIRLFYGV
ncbi:MAG: hypothetical protein AAF199_03995, partial [Pseudomonadota bacterium]